MSIFDDLMRGVNDVLIMHFNALGEDKKALKHWLKRWAKGELTAEEKAIVTVVVADWLNSVTSPEGRELREHLTKYWFTKKEMEIIKKIDAQLAKERREELREHLDYGLDVVDWQEIAEKKGLKRWLNRWLGGELTEEEKMMVAQMVIQWFDYLVKCPAKRETRQRFLREGLTEKELELVRAIDGVFLEKRLRYLEADLPIRAVGVETLWRFIKGELTEEEEEEIKALFKNCLEQRKDDYKLKKVDKETWKRWMKGELTEEEEKTLIKDQQEISEKIKQILVEIQKEFDRRCKLSGI